MSRPCVRAPAGALLTLAATVAIAGEPRPASDGPGEAGRGPAPSPSSKLDVRGVDFVVLIWYRRDDPLQTFQYENYDVRKGEYTGAVDDWLELMREKHPRYVVRVLRVNLARERGATEKLKVGSVIHRELLAAAAQSGVILGAPLRLGTGPSAAGRPAPRNNLWTGIPGSGGTSDINPVTNTSPFPMPYPRPHP